jgi:hypothetical protein
LVPEHLDDFVLYDRWRSVLVAIMALCMDWVFNCRCLHLPDWSDRRNLSYLFPGCRPILVWHLGFALARLQQSCYGLYLVCIDHLFQHWRLTRQQVRCAILDRRSMRHSNDPINLDCLCRTGSGWTSQFHACIIWHKHHGFSFLLPLLGRLFACYLVSCPQNPTSLHCEGILRTNRRHHLLWMGNWTS